MGMKGKKKTKLDTSLEGKPLQAVTLMFVQLKLDIHNTSGYHVAAGEEKRGGLSTIKYRVHTLDSVLTLHYQRRGEMCMCETRRCEGRKSRLVIWMA